jgi:rod shape-determining protein MreD
MADHFALRGIAPGLVLIAVVNWGILRGMDQGMLWGLVGGACLDVFTRWPLGTSAVALVLVASLVSLGQTTFIRTHVLLPPATVFLATILYYLIALFILTTLQQPTDWVAAIRSYVLPVAVYNGVLNIPGFWLTQRLENRVYPMPRANW